MKLFGGFLLLYLCYCTLFCGDTNVLELNQTYLTYVFSHFTET